MAKLLVIADDLTGALDSGVQLASKGDRVLVSLDRVDGMARAGAADVIVIDSESRHDSAAVAHDKVFQIAQDGLAQGIRGVYKKTDSGLRGNVGAELAAVLEATGAARLDFVPAYPKQQRTTEGGVHYVAGVPLAQSVFAVDPVNPVTCSRVSDLVHLQTDVAATSWEQGSEQEGIVVHDCATDDDMRRIAERLSQEGAGVPMAGCAGLLEMLPACSEGRTSCTLPTMSPQLVVVSGSVNAVTASQLDEAQRRGAWRIHLPVRDILTDGWDEAEARAFVTSALAQAAGSPLVLFDTIGVQLSTAELADTSLPRKISAAAGLCAALVAELSEATVMMVGGDALVAFVHDVGATLLEPLDELFPGIVVARYEGPEHEGILITKSGAFGNVGLFDEVRQVLEKNLEGTGGTKSCR